MKNPFQYTETELYEFMLKQGERRFGSECKHERVRNGRCLNCLRRVITKSKMSSRSGIDGKEGK